MSARDSKNGTGGQPEPGEKNVGDLINEIEYGNNRAGNPPLAFSSWEEYEASFQHGPFKPSGYMTPEQIVEFQEANAAIVKESLIIVGGSAAIVVGTTTGPAIITACLSNPVA